MILREAWRGRHGEERTHTQASGFVSENIQNRFHVIGAGWAATGKTIAESETEGDYYVTLPLGTSSGGPYACS